MQGWWSDRQEVDEGWKVASSWLDESAGGQLEAAGTQPQGQPERRWRGNLDASWATNGGVVLRRGRVREELYLELAEGPMSVR